MAKLQHRTSSGALIPEFLVPGGGKTTSFQNGPVSSGFNPRYTPFPRQSFHDDALEPMPLRPMAQAYPPVPPRPQASPLHAALWGGHYSAVPAPVPYMAPQYVNHLSFSGRSYTEPNLHSASMAAQPVQMSFHEANRFSGSVESGDRYSSSIGTASVVLKDQDIANFLKQHPNSTNAMALLEHLDKNGVETGATFRRNGAEDAAKFPKGEIPDLSRMIGLRDKIEGQMKWVQQKMKANAISQQRTAPPPPPLLHAHTEPNLQAAGMTARPLRMSFDKAYRFNGSVESEDRYSSTVGTVSLVLKDQDIADFLEKHPHETDASEMLRQLTKSGVKLNATYRKNGAEEAQKFGDDQIPDLSRMIGLRDEIEGQMKWVRQKMTANVVSQPQPQVLRPSQAKPRQDQVSAPAVPPKDRPVTSPASSAPPAKMERPTPPAPPPSKPRPSTRDRLSAKMNRWLGAPGGTTSTKKPKPEGIQLPSAAGLSARQISDMANRLSFEKDDYGREQLVHPAGTLEDGLGSTLHLDIKKNDILRFLMTQPHGDAQQLVDFLHQRGAVEGTRNSGSSSSEVNRFVLPPDSGLEGAIQSELDTMRKIIAYHINKGS